MTRKEELNTVVKEPVQVYDRSKSVCPLLPKQECPHGITGLSGGPCEHYHPTWCRRFMRNGPKGKRGCDKGDDCRFFHPQLCHNALVTMACYNQDCKLIHIRGVKRVQKPDEKTDPKTKSSKKDELSKKRKSDHNPPPKRGTSRVPPKSTKGQSSSNSSPGPLREEDFLKHLAKMKADLTTEVSKDLSKMVQASLQSLLPNQNHPFHNQKCQCHMMYPCHQRPQVQPIEHPPRQHYSLPYQFQGLYQAPVSV